LYIIIEFTQVDRCSVTVSDAPCSGDVPNGGFINCDRLPNSACGYECSNGYHSSEVTNVMCSAIGTWEVVLGDLCIGTICDRYSVLGDLCSEQVLSLVVTWEMCLHWTFNYI
jgi:hypothetical protein